MSKVESGRSATTAFRDKLCKVERKGKTSLREFVLFPRQFRDKLRKVERKYNIHGRRKVIFGAEINSKEVSPKMATLRDCFFVYSHEVAGANLDEEVKVVRVKRTDLDFEMVAGNLVTFVSPMQAILLYLLPNKVRFSAPMDSR
jgi:hypothetical protein